MNRHPNPPHLEIRVLWGLQRLSDDSVGLLLNPLHPIHHLSRSSS